MGVKTSNLRYNSMKVFRDNLVSNTCFMFASTVSAEATAINSDESERIFLEKTIFGKKLGSSSIKFMIKKNLWTAGIVYDQYNDSLDMSILNYYVVSAPQGDSVYFSVFKCINNNSAGISSDRPIYSDSLALQNYMLNTADGYTWKYMFKVNSSDVDKYSSNGYFPIFNDTAVQNSAIAGIDNILVTNPVDNNGYETLSGTISSVAGVDVGGFRKIFLLGRNFNTLDNYYSGFCFYTTSSDGITSKKYIINESGVNSQHNQFVTVSGYIQGDISNLNNFVWSFDILPQVEIVGDGVNASAICTVVNSQIKTVIILENGINYTRAIARIVPPLFGFNPTDYLSTDTICTLKVIIPPRSNNFFGAHGSIPELELNSSKLLITGLFLQADSPPIPETNTYSKIGLVKNPIFTVPTPLLFDNRIKIQLPNVTGLNQNDSVTQSSTDFSGIIHEIDGINNYIYVTEYYGPYSDQSQNATMSLSNIIPLDIGSPLETSIGRIDITSILNSTYVNGSGDVLYINDFYPIQRTSVLTEQFKFILEF